jgi:hypothetical protein
MITHVKIVGVLHIIMGGFGLLIGLAFLVFFGGLASAVGFSDHSRDSLAAIPILGTIGVFLFMLIALLSLPGIVAGVGLLGLKPWARMLTIVLSVLHLFNVPFGTALGVYGLWALLSPETEALFRREPLAAMPRY